MAEAVSVLPPTATPWMRAVEAASAPAWSALPVNLIKDFSDPAKCPAHLLTHLAFENSVDVWEETWSEAKKRAVIARSPELHRLKGTVAGIKAYVSIAGGEVRRAIAPPQGVYAEGEDLAARAAWLARFPEFRVYTAEPWGHDAGDAYPGEAFAGGDGDDGFATPPAPLTRFQARAGVLIRDGVEVQMSRRESVTTVDGVERVAEAFSPTEEDAAGVYADAMWPGDFVEATAALPALTLSLDAAPYAGVAVAGQVFRGPFLESAPERVRDKRPDPAGAYAGGDYLDAAFLDRGLDPAVLTFDRWRLADPRRSAGAVAPGDAFFGDSAFLGLAPFTLLLDVAVEERLQPRTAIAGGFIGDFTEAHDSRRTDLVREAITSAAADRDRVLVRFARHRPQRLGDRPTLPLRLGQLVADF